MKCGVRSRAELAGLVMVLITSDGAFWREKSDLSRVKFIGQIGVRSPHFGWSGARVQLEQESLCGGWEVVRSCLD